MNRSNHHAIDCLCSKEHLQNLTTYDLEKGAYWYIEDYPHTISNELLKWHPYLTYCIPKDTILS